MSTLTAAEVIARLALVPHPEGGHFRETFRDGADPISGRAASTAIYFLLKAGEISRWHRIDATEVWHWYAGAPLRLSIADGRAFAEVRLGPEIARGEHPQAVVPPGAWQQSESLGDWTLAGCTVAPGFLFDRFEMAPLGFDPRLG